MLAATAAESKDQTTTEPITDIEYPKEMMTLRNDGGGFTKLVASVDELIKQAEDFKKLKDRLVLSDTANYNVYSIRGEKKIGINRSGWRLIQTFFGISDRIIYRKRLTDPRNPAVYGYEVHVEMYIPGVKSVIGVGMCWSNEPNKHFPHGEHDVFATAHTRAKNRGTSDFTGAGEPSAEELEAVEAAQAFDKSRAQQAAPAAPAQVAEPPTASTAGGVGEKVEWKSYGSGGKPEAQKKLA